MFRDSNWSSNSQIFNPERALTDMKFEDSWIPFGAGKRECPAKFFVIYFIAAILIECLLKNKFENKLDDDSTRIHLDWESVGPFKVSPLEHPL